MTGMTFTYTQHYVTGGQYGYNITDLLMELLHEGYVYLFQTATHTHAHKDYREKAKGRVMGVAYP